MSARIKPLKVLGVDLFNAGIRVFNALWPDVDAPASLLELVEELMASEDRLSEWR